MSVWTFIFLCDTFTVTVVSSDQSMLSRFMVNRRTEMFSIISALKQENQPECLGVSLNPEYFIYTHVDYQSAKPWQTFWQNNRVTFNISGKTHVPVQIQTLNGECQQSQIQDKFNVSETLRSSLASCQICKSAGFSDCSGPQSPAVEHSPHKLRAVTHSGCVPNHSLSLCTVTKICVFKMVPAGTDIWHHSKNPTTEAHTTSGITYTVIW